MYACAIDIHVFDCVDLICLPQPVFKGIWNGIRSAMFYALNGVKQGGILAPVSF